MSPKFAERRILRRILERIVFSELTRRSPESAKARLFSVSPPQNRAFKIILKSLNTNELQQKWRPDPESNWGHRDFQYAFFEEKIDKLLVDR